MMFDELLIQYGALGIFVCYLIFDRQTLMKRVIASLDSNTRALRAVEMIITKCNKY